MYLTAPLSLLTAKALDLFLGGEPATRYNRSQLKSLLSMHGVDRSDPDHQGPSQSASFILTPTNDRENGLPSSPTNDTIIELRQETPNNLNTNQHIHINVDSPSVDTPHSSSPPATPPPPDDNVNVNDNDNDNDHDTGVNNVSDSSSSQHHSSDTHNDSPQKRNRFNPFSRFLPSNRKQKHDNGSATKKDDHAEVSHPPLTRDEMTMLGGAFDFSQKTVGQVMTSLNDVFMLDESVSLNFKILLLIFQSGHSRIPIYSGCRENIIGLLFAKDLILLDPEDSVPIKTVLSFFNRTMFSVLDDTRLNKMLNLFCQGGGHMAIVRKKHNEQPLQQEEHSSQEQPPQVSTPETIGIVTLEDLIEELIGQDIVDETDVYKNNMSKQRVKRLRSIDPDVLKMFDSTHDEEILSEKEVRVVASYLSSNVEEFSDSVIKLDILSEMLAEIPIIECHGTAISTQIENIDSHDDNEDSDSFHSAPKLNGLLRTQTTFDEIDEDINTSSAPDAGVTTDGLPEIQDDSMIYSKGVPTKNAYLIIHGKLEIIAGDEGFISEAGPWTLLGGRALTQDLYAPDFSARVVERPTRVLRISRKLYRLMLQASENKSTETSRMKNEAILAEQPMMARRESNANRSSPSLAVAAAAAAMAIGSPSDNLPNTPNLLKRASKNH